MPVADYGAEVAGVTNLVPDVTIDEDSVPSVATVGEWLLDYTATVAGTVGSLDAVDDDDQRTDLERRARNLVHLAVAATVEDAVHPSGASTTETSYGTVLWNRYTTGLTALTRDAGILIAGGGTAATSDSPRGAYPPTAIPDRVRW